MRPRVMVPISAIFMFLGSCRFAWISVRLRPVKVDVVQFTLCYAVDLYSLRLTWLHNELMIVGVRVVLCVG